MLRRESKAKRKQSEESCTDLDNLPARITLYPAKMKMQSSTLPTAVWGKLSHMHVCASDYLHQKSNKLKL